MQKLILKKIRVNLVFTHLFPVLLLCIAWGIPGLNAQSTNLFNLSNLETTQLSNEQQKVKLSYDQRSDVSEVSLINLADIEALQQSVKINIQVPGDSITYTFSAHTINAYSSGDFYWYGNLSDESYKPLDSTSCLTGSLSLMKHEDRLFGEMRIDTNYYQIPYLGSGLNGLVKVEADLNSPVCISDGSATTDTLASAVDRVLCPVVQVLILYTQEVLDSFPDVESIGLMGLQNTRQALLNSEVTVEQVDLQLAGIDLLPMFTATGDWLDDTIVILAPNSTARQLRSTYQADLVIILTPNIYPDFRAATFDFGDDPDDGKKAFAFVEVSSTNLPTYSFAHEIGHLFGGRHQVKDNCWKDHDNTGLKDAHAYSFNKGCRILDREKYYKTATSSCSDNAQRVTILHYSNPDVKYNGKKTGKKDESNNAKNFRNSVCRISEYVVSHDLNLTMFVNNNNICPGFQIVIGANAVGDYGPYQYQWRYKVGANSPWLTYTPSPGPENGFTYNVPSNFWGIIYVEVTATNGTDVATATTWVNSNYLLCPHRPSGEFTFPNAATKNNGISIVPNPAIDFIQFRLVQPIETGMADILISDVVGKIHYVQSVYLKNNTEEAYEIYLPELPSGNYILTIKSKNSPSLAHRFTILR